MNHLYAGPVRHMRHKLTSLVLVMALVALALPPLAALAQTAPEPIQVSGTPVLVSGGAGNQTDPHISGTLVSYTNSGSTLSEIRYHDLATNSDAGIPQDTHRDSLSAVSGTTIVFRRIYADGSTSNRPIMAFDTANPSAGVVELNPVDVARREFSSIGGRTVAWMEWAGASSSQSDIVAYDLDSDQAIRLTTDGASANNRNPAVSPDGSVITWAKCASTGTGCDIYVARKSAVGIWGAAIQIGADPGEEILPDTNGQVIIYSSNAAGDFDIQWVNTDGTGESQLPMSGVQYNPNLSGNLIAFESEAVGTTNADIFVYDLSSELLYQVTNTADVDETLNDISVGADGTVRMVWAQADSPLAGNNDVYATSFELVDSDSPSYEICPLFDQSKSHRVNSTVQIRLQLCDAQGQNLSSAELALAAVDLVQVDSTSSPAVVEAPGNSNPDSSFRYDEDIEGYAFNLKTKNLSAGTWELQFTVSGDSTTYGVRFDLR